MVSVLGPVLMAVSNAVSWYLVLGQSSSSLSELRAVVWKIALFYALWALHNRYRAGRDKELGHYSFSLFTAACLESPADPFRNTKIPLILTCLMVLINFAGVLPLIVSLGGIQTTAKKIHRSDSKMVVVWGYIFTTYIVSNIALWSYCCYLFVKYPLEASTVIGTEDEL